MGVELRTDTLEPWRELAEAPDGGLGVGGYGATCAFVGTMRDFNEGDNVSRMVLEHYPGMTERQLETIIAEEGAAYGLMATRVIHRVGPIDPGEPIVLVAVWTAHRREAFEGARAIMEALKSKAPFWKHEQTDSGGRWVEHNTKG